MPTPFQKNLGWSTLAHLLLIACLAFGFSLPEKKKVESIQWIDTTLVSPDSGQPTESPPSPPPLPQEPEPIPSPTPEPPPSALPSPDPEPVVRTPPARLSVSPPEPHRPKPNSPPKKTPPPSLPSPPVKKSPPPKPSTPQIKISTHRVTRPVAASPASKNSESSVKSERIETGFDPNRFAKTLASKLSGTVFLKGKSDAGSSDFSPYLSHVMQEMYNAWRPPLGQNASKPSSVVIRVEKNGAITKVFLATSSGKRLMDDSALTAARSVKKLNPLPKGLGPEFEEITVNFKAQQP